MVGLSSYISTALALTGIVSQVWASPIEERQAGSFFVITGVTEGGNANRLEIRTLQQNQLQFNLYLLAWERFQAAPQGQKASYYGTAGIHGNPIKAWDGVTGSGNSGYCPHSSNLFGPWHRPYLALMEQRLHFYAVQVANEFPAGTQRTQNLAAAATLRLPYWDWALNTTPVLPSAITSQTISVTRPNGQQQSIPNPLYAYRFHPLSASDFGNFAPFSTFETTKRAPQGTAPNAQSNNGAVENTLRGQVGGFRSRLYNLFMNGGDYQFVSNHGSGGNSDTFEAMHDSIHGSFGTNAHMLYLSFSSFDPVFYLHHANVDRQLAIWQYLWPSTYVRSARQSSGTYTIRQGSNQDANSPLTPFHRDAQGTFWNSNQARDRTAFHYDYPEIAGNPSQANVRAAINRLYGSGAAGVSPQIANKLKTRSLLDLTPPNIDLNISPDDVLEQYVVSIGAPLNGLEGPYSTHVFLGDFDESNVASYPTQANYCGSHTVLGNHMGANNLVYGQIILTQALLKKFAGGALDGLDKDTVISFIKDNIHWRVTQNSQLVEGDAVPDIDVQLFSNELKPKTGPTDFPTVVKSDLHHGFLNSTMGGLRGKAPCPW